jgi:predicted restriction endonuclease
VKRKPAIYCSVRCQKDDEYHTFVRKWLNDEVDGTRAYDVTSRHIRRYIVEKYGERCQMCGWAERHQRTGKIPIHLDHVDGNARNNKEPNLRLLCPNHHSLTMTFGGANAGNGRAGRRARYMKVARA